MRLGTEATNEFQVRTNFPKCPEMLTLYILLARQNTHVNLSILMLSHVDEVALLARDGDTGTVPALGFDVLADATNVDREVRLLCSCDGISKPLVICTVDIRAPWSIVDLLKLKYIPLKCMFQLHVQSPVRMGSLLGM